MTTPPDEQQLAQLDDLLREAMGTKLVTQDQACDLRTSWRTQPESRSEIVVQLQKSLAEIHEASQARRKLQASSNEGMEHTLQEEPAIFMLPEEQAVAGLVEVARNLAAVQTAIDALTSVRAKFPEIKQGCDRALHLMAFESGELSGRIAMYSARASGMTLEQYHQYKIQEDDQA